MKAYLFTVLYFSNSIGEVDYKVTAKSFSVAQSMVMTDKAVRFSACIDSLIVDCTEEESLAMALLGNGDINLCQQVVLDKRTNPALSLAWLLLKAHRLMTVNVKSLSYFIRIAYKMLKNEAHYIHVLKGLSIINSSMIIDRRVTTTRALDFSDLYRTMRRLAGTKISNKVAW